MQRIELIFEGIIPSKKNSKRIIRVGNKRRIISSKQYINWENKHMDLLAQVSADIVNPINTPCKITVQFEVATKRKFDLSNKFESIADLLVKAQILKDDNWGILPNIQLEFLGYTGKQETKVIIDY